MKAIGATIIQECSSRPYDDRSRVLDTPLVIKWWYEGNEEHAKTFSVCVGFITDLASTPRLFWRIFPPFGLHEYAAIAHDFLYRKSIAGIDKDMADQIFLALMNYKQVKKWRALTMYKMVSWFGKRNYHGWAATALLCIILSVSGCTFKRFPTSAGNAYSIAWFSKQGMSAATYEQGSDGPRVSIRGYSSESSDEETKKAIKKLIDLYLGK